MSTVYIQKEKVDHINLTNDTGAALAQYEFTVIGGLCLVADEAIANGVVGSFHLEENLVFQTDDLVAGENTFATVNQDVYWDPSSGDFSDTEDDTYYKVGILRTIKDSNGMILVVKDRDTTLDSALDAYIAADVVVTDAFIAADVVVTNAFEAADAILRAEPRILVQKITADASAGIAVTGLVEGDEVVDVTIICTASNANGTLILETGDDDDITDGMICAVDTTRVAAGTIDDANSVLPAAGAQILSVGGTAADTRGIMIITYIPVAV